MDALTVDKIAELARAATATTDLTRDITLENGNTFTHRIEATEYGRELGEILTPPQPKALLVTTLTGLVDAIQAGTYDPGTFLVHVEDFLTVSLKQRTVDAWGNRATHVTAKHTPLGAFVFDQYYADLPKFLIHLQSTFLTTDALLYVIKVASNLKAANTIQSADDGFSQTLTLKTGEVSTAEVTIKPRIALVPMRTFPEAAPVESEFLIRFTQTPGQAPSIALFDVSGKVWMGQQMAAIKSWLAGKIDAAFPIIA